jgi:hypothetical protein
MGLDEKGGGLMKSLALEASLVVGDGCFALIFKEILLKIIPNLTILYIVALFLHYVTYRPVISSNPFREPYSLCKPLVLPLAQTPLLAISPARPKTKEILF